MNTKQLKYVITLSDTGSFSVAAELLNISQPSLSQYIKKIESEVGISLFERTNSNVKATDAGKVYIETGRKILDLEHQMTNRLDDIKNFKGGSVTVGTSPFRSVTLMPSVLASFKKEYSAMYVTVREMATQELLDCAERGEFDLCVTPLPVNEDIFDYQVLWEEEFLLAVKKNSDLDLFLSSNATYAKESKHPTIDINLLSGKDFVMLTENQIMQKTLRSLSLKYNLELHSAAIVKSIEAQIEMVNHGIGAALVPDGVQKPGRINNNLSYYSFVQKLPNRKLAVIYNKNKYLSKPAKDLIKIMKTI